LCKSCFDLISRKALNMSICMECNQSRCEVGFYRQPSCTAGFFLLNLCWGF
jgi:hypothetical protein